MYKFSHIEKISPTLKQVTNIGSATHRILELWAKYPGTKLDYMHQRWVDALARLSPEYSDDDVQVGRKLLQAYEETVRDDPLFDTSGSLEQRLTMLTPCVNDFVGVVDRIIWKQEDGRKTATIIEYKTGPGIVDFSDPKSTFQIRCYMALVSRWYPDMPPSSVSTFWFNLRTGQKYWLPFSDDLMTQTMDEIDTLVNEIHNDKSFEKSPGSHCGWCGYSHHCKSGL